MSPLVQLVPLHPALTTELSLWGSGIRKLLCSYCLAFVVDLFLMLVLFQENFSSYRITRETEEQGNQNVGGEGKEGVAGWPEVSARTQGDGLGVGERPGVLPPPPSYRGWDGHV